MIPVDDKELRQWVSSCLAALDTTPRARNWRQKAVGMPKADAIAMVPRYGRLDLRLTTGELRILQHCADAREMTLRGWLRAATATAAVCCEGMDREELPSLMSAGLLVPR